MGVSGRSSSGSLELDAAAARLLDSPVGALISRDVRCLVGVGYWIILAAEGSKDEPTTMHEGQLKFSS